MKTTKTFLAVTLAAASTLFAIAVSTPAQACSYCGGTKLNGTELNGFQLNGWKVNGVQFNGMRVNGLQFNGSGKNVAGQIVAVTLPN
jgi:hypothetical protein